MTSHVLSKPVIGEVLAYLTRTIAVWYVIAVLVEMALPGFVSNRINLDSFLWFGILSALFSLLIDPRALINNQKR